MAIQDLRFSVKVLIFPFFRFTGRVSGRGPAKLRYRYIRQNFRKSFHYSLCVSFQSMICDHTGAILMTWKEHERLHCLNNLGQWWYFVVFAVVLMCVNLGNEKCGIQPRFRNRLLGWKNKSIMIQLAKIVPINIIALNFYKMVVISAIWNCYLKRSPFLWSSPWWRPELRGHSGARWNGLLFKLLSLWQSTAWELNENF